MKGRPRPGIIFVVAIASTLHRTLRHWRAFVGIYIQDGLAYKASGVIWILTDAVNAFVMPMVLIAAGKGGAISGFDPNQIVLYYLVSLLVTCFVTCHFMWEFAMEIKEGQFSTFLLRPTSFLQFMGARNLAWRCVRTMLFLPMFALMLFAYSAFLDGAVVHITGPVLLSVLLGHLVSFLTVMALATIALFVQDATSIFELYYIPMLFLSGQMFPVAMFPEWAQTLSRWTPFYYTTGFPTELALGRVADSQVWPMLGIQLMWIMISYFAFRFGMSRGLRHYTGVGM